MPPQNSYVEFLVPNAMLTSQTSEKWLGPEGSETLNGLIHLWVHNFMTLLRDYGN
jgi:hypothetical protein